MKRERVSDPESSGAVETGVVEIDEVRDFYARFRTLISVMKARVCCRRKCIEGMRRRDGTFVTFNARKKNGGHYKECDQCRGHTHDKNKDPDVGNAKNNPKPNQLKTLVTKGNAAVL
ncbi:hypothetical protein HK100_010065 [Physocladia obscura]|uniref:Uncharacterized protein n=1 Tax=Physocladia obscura TaxID=109957 RepID=A0AAD5TBJ4_9FUNG|nr:hypothetical protein HK100_010065 [Physocladia obscura]